MPESYIRYQLSSPLKRAQRDTLAKRLLGYKKEGEDRDKRCDRGSHEQGPFSLGIAAGLVPAETDGDRISGGGPEQPAAHPARSV